MLIGPIAIYQFYHCPHEEFGGYLRHLIVIIRDQGTSDRYEIAQGITES